MELENAKKRFGFGCMRLPMKDDHVDIEEFTRMADAFIANGFNYFDTAHGYIDGQSEKAIKEVVSSRYPRDKYLLTNKLTEPYFHNEEDIVPFFKSQLELCGVEYFDNYLMHAQNARNFEHFKRCRAYETAFELKRLGYIRHVGISFHDTPEVLDRILTEYPEIEMVQIQFNYLDYVSDTVQSKGCYDVCVKHGKPIIIMEPVKGGTLVNLPDEAKKVFDGLHNGSYASYAVRFCLHHPQVAMVLSGMSNMEQMEDNIKTTKDFVDLSDTELKAIEQVRDIIISKDAIPCTRCRYCVEESHCPKNIEIPELFRAYNARKAFHDWGAGGVHRKAIEGKGSASDCIKCGMCERVCPQGLKIRDLLVKVAEEFEK
ncbi:MAG: 4Fe-4S dicluster domain-containing protein [Erysipelotrichaceae bacterium]|nr:4Fe-4S dicluster domain-containing protein [Erysipelotrichaceae bacterium]